MGLLSILAVRLLIEQASAHDWSPARRMAVLCVVAAAGSGFLWFWAAAAGMNGSGLMDSLDLRLFETVIGQTPPGRVWIVRCGIGILLGGTLFFARRRWTWWLAALLAAALTGSIAWLGHAGASEDARRPGDADGGRGASPGCECVARGVAAVWLPAEVPNKGQAIPGGLRGRQAFFLR